MAYNVYFCCERCGITVNWINQTVSMSSAVSIARDYGWQVGKRGWFCQSCRSRKREKRRATDIDQAPTIEAEPVKHGHWTIETDEHLDSVSGEIDEEFYLKCSECGREVWGIDHMTVLHGTDEEIFGEYPYCHCGAKMDGERVALEEVVDIDAQTQRNNAAMRRVIDFVMDGGNDHD